MTEYGRVKFCMSEEADLSPAIEAYCRYLPHDHASRSDMVEHMRVVTLKFGERITLVTDWETGTVVADRAADAAELCRMAGANTPAEVLTCLCANRAAADEEALVRFEPELYALEERFVTGRLRARDTGRELMRLRKRLLALHQRYAVLSVVLEEIADEAGRDALGSAIRRADRLRGAVANLGEYLTQVRDAHQAYASQRQNSIMQTFTVIAAIFMPLQLITGWYGMNLIMPETRVGWAYPTVFAASAALAVGMLIFFHRKKWL